MKKKCAICFSGQVRTGERKTVKNNLEINLYQPLIKNNYELFYFYSCEKPFNGYEWSGESVIKDENYWGEYLNLLNSRRHPDIKGGAFNVMNQWKKCQEVCLQKNNYEKSNNIIFDLVIRTRPDIILKNKLDIDSINIDIFNIPNHDNWWGYNDRFCIGNSANMNLYMINFIDNIIDYFIKDNLLFHSEILLKHHLDKYNIGINRPNIQVLFEREKGPAYEELCFN